MGKGSIVLRSLMLVLGQGRVLVNAKSLEVPADVVRKICKPERSSPRRLEARSSGDESRTQSVAGFSLPSAVLSLALRQHDLRLRRL